MSTKTPNYNFTKPEKTDAADITAQNGNWDILDTQLKNILNEAKQRWNTLAVYKANADTTLSPVILTDVGTTPGVGFWYIHTTFYGQISETTNRKQVAYGYTDNAIYTRFYNNGAWQSWVKVALSSEVDLKANKSDHNVRTLTSLAQLGLTAGSETIQSIANAMDTWCELLCATGSTNASIYPDTFGILRVWCVDNSRVIFKWTSKDTTAEYSGVYCATNTTPWSGWKKHYSEACKPTASEVGALPDATVPVGKGGTGATNSADALKNLGLTATATELNRTKGLTGDIQTQLNGKAPTSHKHTTTDISDLLTATYDATASRTANSVLVAPNGSNGKATFRKLEEADIPSLSVSKVINLQPTLNSKMPQSATYRNVELSADEIADPYVLMRITASLNPSLHSLFGGAVGFAHFYTTWYNNGVGKVQVAFAYEADSTWGGARMAIRTYCSLENRGWTPWRLVGYQDGTDITSKVSVGGSNGSNPIRKAVDTGTSIMILFNEEQEFADINLTVPSYLQSKLVVSAVVDGTKDCVATDGKIGSELGSFSSTFSGSGTSLEIKYM